MTVKDLSQASSLLRTTFPSLASASDEQIKSSIISQATANGRVGMVAKNQNDEVMGVMIYETIGRNIDVKIIAVYNEQAGYSLIHQLMAKIPRVAQGIAIRFPLDYAWLYQDALKKFKFQTKLEGNIVVATVGEWGSETEYEPNFTDYQGDIADPDGSEDDDPYGLFKDKPWGQR